MPPPFPSPSTSSSSNPNVNEQKWVMSIRQSLEQDHYIDIGPICIFNVPTILFSISPNSYVPQEVPIGPYHWRPEVRDIERYKLAAARRNQNQLQKQGFKLDDIIYHLKKMLTSIRAYYHKFLNLEDETLAFMMAIDASFLIEFLLTPVEDVKVLRGSDSDDSISHLLHRKCTSKSTYNAILRDLVMMENQIPLFVLGKAIEVEFSSSGKGDIMLQNMLMGFCKELSPFPWIRSEVSVFNSHHLLDHLYKVLVSEQEIKGNETTGEELDESSQPSTFAGGTRENIDIIVAGGDSGTVKQATGEIWKILSKLNVGPIKFITKSLTKKPVRVLFQLPGMVMSNVPGASTVAQQIKNRFFPLITGNKKDKNEESSPSSNVDDKYAPLFEELTIPSVSELISSNIRFKPVYNMYKIPGNISSIIFDTKTATLHLPIIRVNVNTEVVLRNLVAYETLYASGPLIFTRYIELMNGIIDKPEDVELLRKRGIIINWLKSDADVANMFNGMTRSIRLNKVPKLDKVIKDVNDYYNGKWKVKMRNCITYYVFESWKYLTVAATILMLLLTTVQAVCSVYNCPRLLRMDESAAHHP